MADFDQTGEVLDNIEEGRAPIKVDMRHQKPLNDPKCNHEWYLDETDEDSKWADIVKCRKCPAGMPFDTGVGRKFVDSLS